MKYSIDEIIQYIEEEDVKFIRLAFVDVFGKQKNVSIMPCELIRAFKYGIAIDASAITGFGGQVHSGLLLHPDPDTLAVLPWRPEHGRVIRMFCNITYPDGTQFENDTRQILISAIEYAKSKGYTFRFGPELEFYLFKLDENGDPTKVPYDNAGYMDISPDDKGENARRDICLALEKMGIIPESSHHEEGPGQNEIDFRYADALTSADNAITFEWVVKAIAYRNGLWADFTPKPIDGKPGNGHHINVSVISNNGNNENLLNHMIAGILNRVCDITLFLNPSDDSYKRLGKHKAPKYVSWSSENRSQLIRVPAAIDEYERAELRSPDSMSNPYIDYALLIYAGLEGIENKLELDAPADINLYTVSEETLAKYKALPSNREEAIRAAVNSDFVKEHLPESLINIYRQ